MSFIYNTLPQESDHSDFNQDPIFLRRAIILTHNFMFSVISKHIHINLRTIPHKTITSLVFSYASHNIPHIISPQKKRTAIFQAVPFQKNGIDAGIASAENKNVFVPSSKEHYKSMNVNKLKPMLRIFF